LPVIRDSLKHRLNALLASRGFRVHRVPRPLNDRPEAWLRLSLELLAPYALAGCDPVYFVQIGANDGDMSDPISRLVREHGWRGALVEPQPEVFKALQQNYDGVGGLTFVNAAVDHRPGKRVLYTVAPDASLPEYVSGLASFNKNVILSHRTRAPGVEGFIREVEVECVTIDDVVARSALPRVDVLQIDVEGFDAEVLRMVDFGRMRPRLVSYEWKHLSRADYDDAAALLVRNGYQLAVAGADMLAVAGDLRACRR